jgi:hypothetical protein
MGANGKLDLKWEKMRVPEGVKICTTQYYGLNYVY